MAHPGGQDEVAAPACRAAIAAGARACSRKSRALNGGSKYIFRSLHARGRPMSENTVNGALRRMGYSGDEMTAHGLRATASTLLNESGLWSHDAIERALAHQDHNAIRGIYHRGQHWEERVRMAQWWSDFLDEIKGEVARPEVEAVQ